MRKEITLFAGEPRGGKTYAAEKLCHAHPGGALVYGYGMPTDFQGFHEVRLLSPLETADIIGFETRRERADFMAYPEIRFFEWKGHIYDVADFEAMFSGRKVKIPCIESQSEQNVARFVFEYYRGGVVVFDDNRRMTRHGLSPQFVNLLSRSNHSGSKLGGKSRGCDIVLIYHNVDKAPTELFDYVTSYRLFKMKRPPADKTDSADLYAAFMRSHRLLDTAEKYTSIFLTSDDPETLRVIKPGK